jgi:hypothetical protein
MRILKSAAKNCHAIFIGSPCLQHKYLLLQRRLDLGFFAPENRQ